MSSRSWQDLRESGFRIFFIGLFSIIIAFIIYARFTVPFPDQPNMPSFELLDLARATLAITAASMLSMGYGAWTIFRSEQLRMTSTFSNDSLTSYIVRTFSDKSYQKIMVISTIGYGILFGFLSQILVYRADDSLIKSGIAIPSFSLTPCCNFPGYVPMFTAYLADHFLILVIPINVILASVVSLLVGFNVALSISAFRMRRKMQTTSAKTSFVGGMGAASGLFVGCPTCAGSLFSSLLGFGVGTSITVLAPFQTLFIILSIPALLVSPFIIAREMRTVSSCKSSTG